MRDADLWRWNWDTARPCEGGPTAPALKLPLASVPRPFHRAPGQDEALHALVREVLGKVSRLELAAPSSERWVTLTEATRRIPIRNAEARTLLRVSGLVERVGGREMVWLPALYTLAERLEEQADPRRRKRTRRALPAAAPANDLVPIPPELLAG